jgi:ribonuclease E
MLARERRTGDPPFMTKRMLIDASHGEETRVVVLDGSRLEDFDVETAAKRQLKGNIYLAKIVRVEPSLQAAFVEYGGNRHGFLAFGEIHPDYYQIPIADRQRIIAMQEEDARAEAAADDAAAQASEAGGRGERRPPADAGQSTRSDPDRQGASRDAGERDTDPADEAPHTLSALPDREEQPAARALASGQDERHGPADETPDPDAVRAGFPSAPADPELPPADDADASEQAVASLHDHAAHHPAAASPQDEAPGSTNGGSAPVASEREHARATSSGERPDSREDRGDERPQPRYLRHYKIQDVIRRRQILLIQVVKEERGSKGAALTTFISLAGRFSVLMPNSPRGGGVSRKITSAADRRRLKEVTAELDLPRGMGMIIRTAGAARPKPEITRDCDYLLRLWDDIRDQTMRSMAPALIHEEASLIKRSIRDVYSRDVDDILVDGEEGWRAARDYMRLLMPAHARKVQLWQNPSGQPLFASERVEAQLDAMLSPTVQLKSGGYLVINQTEALVAIDVNSGRSTKERGIEETALRTNLEAADEMARQLRLRDLAGLIVIDFIDMESRRNNAAVEKRIKDALKDDRARIQLGSISGFGLFEMSRQRLRPSLAETSFVPCPHCDGTGHVRSTENASLHVLRAVEEAGARHRGDEIQVHVASPTAIYLLNHKRSRVAEIESRYEMRVCFAGDESLLPAQTRIARVRALAPTELPPAPSDLRATRLLSEEPEIDEPELSEEPDIEQSRDELVALPAAVTRVAGYEDVLEGETAEEGEARRKRRRRRRGGRRKDETDATLVVGGDAAAPQPDAEQPELPALEGVVQATPETVDLPDPAFGESGLSSAVDAVDSMDGEQPPTDPEAGEDSDKPRRRGRRGGRRRRRDEDEPAAPAEAAPYAGLTPANPYASGIDIFDVMELAEEREAQLALRSTSTPAAAAYAAHPTPASAEPAPFDTPADQAVTATPDSVEPEAAASTNMPAEPVLDLKLPEPAAAPSSDPDTDMSAEAERSAIPDPHDAAPTLSVEPKRQPKPDQAIAEPAQLEPTQPVAAEPPAEKRRGWWKR